MAEAPEKNLAMDIVRITEAAALSSARWLGRGNKEAGDGAAVEAMRNSFTTLHIQGTVVIGGITQESVQQAAELAIAMQAAGEPRAMPLDYEDVNVGAKVVKLIQSYTPIVNETVWLKR